MTAPRFTPGGGQATAAPAAIGEYAALRQVGAGSMGTIYEGRARDGRRVAIKLMRGGLGEAGRVRFAREARLLTGLDHPAIVGCVDHGFLPDGRPYLVMEWLEGEDLATRLRRGPLAIDEAIALAARLASALATVHERGVVHRDLKPGNVFLIGGDVEGAKLLDFGVAHTDTSTQVTQVGDLIGTLGYMAPEQARGQADIDARADLFSLACVLYECVGGRPAFSGGEPLAVLARLLIDTPPPLRSLRPQVSPLLDQLLAEMFDKQPEGRPASARAVLARLEALTGEHARRGDSGPISITDAERRLFVVLFARMPEELTLAPTLPAEDTGSSHALASFRAMAHPFVVHYSPLLGGTLLMSRDLAGAAGDDAALLARRALALRAAFPGISLALAAGHGMRSQQALAGQVLDAAAELLACTTGDEITLDEATAELLAPRFVVSAAPREGAAPPLRRLTGERDAPAMRTVLGRETPFVGRSHELGVVVATFAAMTLDPRGTLLLITAEPGLGKSRLVHESLVAIRAQHRGAFVLAAHGTPLGETTALGAIARLVRRIGAGGPGSAHDPDGAADERPLAARIAERLRRVLPADEVAATTDALVALAAVLADEGRALAHVADAAKLAWLRWLAAECAVQPVILALDDLHCWDLPSVQFVQAALEQAGEAPLFVLAAGRPEGRERAPRMYALAGAVHLELSPLFARASERLVREFLPTSDGEVVRAIARRSQGNAYFLEELIRAAVAGEQGEAPPGVLATVQARLGRLGEADRRLLRAASVFGPAFADVGVSAVAQVPVAEVRPRLAAFESQELIIRSLAAGGGAHRTYNFRHALTHEAAYATLTDDDRARGHLAAAEWLESQPAHDEAAIAGHFQRGKANARARRWYLKAAERAVGLGNFPEATRSADRCVELGATGLELGLARLAQAEVSAWSGTLAGGFERAREASELLPVGTAPYFRALALCLQIATLHRDLTDLRARVREALFVEPAAGGESGWIRYMCEAAYAAVIVGHTGESAAIMARLGRVTARQVLPDASVAAILRTRGVMHLYAFEFEEAIEAGRQATDCFEAVGNLRGACWARLGVAQTLQFVGAYAQAERIMRAVGGLADKLDASLLQIYQLTRLGTLCLQTGRQDEALACFQRALAISVACGNSRGVGNSRTALAWYWLERGDPEQAEPLARSAADELGLQRAFVRASQGFLARTLLAQGRIEEADAVADAVERDLFAGVVDFEAEHLQTLVAVRGAAHGELAGRRALQRAVDHLARRHASLRDPELRRGYAAQRPIRELLALAARRGLPGASW